VTLSLQVIQFMSQMKTLMGADVRIHAPEASGSNGHGLVTSSPERKPNRPGPQLGRETGSPSG
jgi:hypothetical protein